MQVRKLVLLSGLPAAAFLAIAASTARGAESSREGEPANATKVNSTMKNVILIGGRRKPHRRH
jgi:hypothetical protein